uniref:Uncharacterized protein n=1 Tax=viral metagenome TaxID=1070528 RepID=A0A6C0JPF8_9ZZZZ
MKAEEFYTIFQQKYSIIKDFEMERYKLEQELFLFKKLSNPKMLSPLITFTIKTFQWPNPQYETNEQISFSNTLVAMDQYIIDVEKTINDQNIQLNLYKK